jgi:hypothetical protein
MERKSANRAWLVRVVHLLDAFSSVCFLIWLWQPRHSSLGTACFWDVLAWCVLRCGLNLNPTGTKSS